jgi:photosynthetic reaction center H subunit
MQTGAFTQYIDVAQVVLYLFWIFFAGLIYYLRREDKREGYPLESDRSGHVVVQGFPAVPAPKTFRLRDGTTRVAPNPANSGATPNLPAQPIGPWLGAPLEPTGNPMLDGVGPGAYANRPDIPDKTLEGANKIVPLRIAPECHLEPRDIELRGLEVRGADRATGGVVTDLWVDRSESIIRYLEVAVKGPAGTRKVLLPINFCAIDRWPRHVIDVKAVMGHHFADVPATKSEDAVTFLEEERIMAYYGGGLLYADSSRTEPLI